MRPFKIQTPDGEALYAWHILPIAVYAKSEVDLILDPTGSDIDVTKTTAFRLLKEDPESRLIISCQYFVLVLSCACKCSKLTIWQSMEMLELYARGGELIPIELYQQELPTKYMC